MNRLYFVSERDECAGIFVAEESNNKAKMYGCGTLDCNYIDTRAYLVKNGCTFYDDIDTRETGFNVIGKGVIVLDTQGELDWKCVKDFLLQNGRAELFVTDEEGNEIKVEVK